MNDKDYAAQKARLKKLIDKWVKPIGLGWWNVQFAYSREPLDLGPHIANTGTEQCVAKTHAHWQYLDALIEWNMQRIEEMDDEDLERAFVHELCHVFVNEMRMWGNAEMETEKADEAIRHEERVVTQLTNAFLWTRRAGTGEGRAEWKRSRSSKVNAQRKRSTRSR
jgi:hypothetical protein